MFSQGIMIQFQYVFSTFEQHSQLVLSVFMLSPGMFNRVFAWNLLDAKVLQIFVVAIFSNNNKIHQTLRWFLECNKPLVNPPYSRFTASSTVPTRHRATCQARDAFLLNNKGWCARFRQGWIKEKLKFSWTLLAFSLFQSRITGCR